MSVDLDEKPYSPGQIFKSVWDETENRIRVDAEVTAVIGELAVDLDQSDDSVAIGDGTNLVSINPDGALSVEINGPDIVSNYDSDTVAINDTATILSKTFIGDQKLKSILVSGDNLGKYTVFLNSNELIKIRTTWGNYNEEISLNDLKVFSGDLLEIQVLNNSTSSSEFNATLIYQGVS